MKHRNALIASIIAGVLLSLYLIQGVGHPLSSPVFRWGDAISGIILFGLVWWLGYLTRREQDRRNR